MGDRSVCGAVGIEFPDFVKHVVAMVSKPYDFGADKFKATKAPMFFIMATSTVYGSITSRKRTASRAEICTATCARTRNRDWQFCRTTHVTLMNRTQTIVPMVNDFLDAKPSKK